MSSKIEKLIDEYIGTCNSMDIDTLTIRELARIDEAMFECECCGWWCDRTDEAEHKTYEQICTDCFENE